MNWSRGVHNSRADIPLFLTRALRLAVATHSRTCVMAPPVGCWCNISPSRSRMAFSATGFLLMFLTRPSSIVSRYLFNIVSLTRAANPGAGSVRITAGGPSSGRRPIQSWMSESRHVSRRSSLTKHVTVYDVTHPRSTKISCLSHLMMSAAYEMPTTSGGSVVDYVIGTFGVFRNEVQ